MAAKTEFVPLGRVEMNALGGQIMGFRHWFKPAPVSPLVKLVHRLDAAIARQNRSSFVRLTTRSPKDSIAAELKGMCVSDGAKALALFVEGSERCAADLRMALDHSYDMSIAVRSWLDFPPWLEFRCFMVNRRWVGACQHQHLYGSSFPAIIDQTPAILLALKEAMNCIIESSSIPDAAFDLVFRPSSAEVPSSTNHTLLDVNPLLDVTDTGFFSAMSEFDRTFRFRHGNAVCKVPIQE